MRMEFKIQIMATPVSAKTAAHMEAKPIRPRTMMSIFIPKAKTTFCHAMRMVSREIFIAWKIE